MSLYKSYSSLGKRADELKHPDPNAIPILRTQNRNHKLKIIRENPIVCVKLYAEWCQPCVKITPEYGRMAREYAAKGCTLIEQPVDQLDKENDPQTTGIPAFHFYLRGQFVKSIMGANLQEVRSELDILIRKNN
jgi:thiol-disulfide isomerase/thioredoxin